MSGVGEQKQVLGNPKQIAAMLIGGQLGMIILAAIWFAFSGDVPSLDKDRPGLAVGSGLILAVALIGLVLAIKRALPAQMAALDKTAARLWAGTGLSFSWPIILCLSAMAGISEELFFRGAIQYALTENFSPLFGLGVASLLFGLGHAISWYYFLLTLFIGFILGGVFLLTGALLPVIIAHILYDVWAFRRLKRLIASGIASDS